MTAGTSSGRRQSAILIPVPQAEPVVGRYRLEYDPVAAAGVPAHITLIVPWLPPDEIEPGDLVELHHALDSAEPFEFVLPRVSWFGRKVLWLAPDPVEPFVKLTSMLADRFGTPPYDDIFDEVVPHLTVAHASDGVELAGVAAELKGRLAEDPIHCQAQQVWVMVGDGLSWAVRDRFELRALQRH
jgi:2'-5' RNA ligase